jgi:peptide-methionine (S)-S-oxide reductase
MKNRLLGLVTLAMLGPLLSAAAPAPARRTESIVFAGGCFWGVEAVFEHVKGVTSAVSGYAGGTMKSPTYGDVSTGSTGYAESVQVVYDPAQVSLEQLLQVFFTVAHDPTQLNRQGPDVGTQYRSAVFYTGATQQQAVQAYIATLTQKKVYSRPIVTEVTPLTVFYPAEAYHQGYLELHPYQPYIVINDKPKLENLRRSFPGLYRETPST